MNTPDRTDPNQNPWYILMTLYGEQDGDEIDWELHEKNRDVWNAWSCQRFSEEKWNEIDATLGGLPEHGIWAEIADRVLDRHKKAFLERNGVDTDYPGIPDCRAPILLKDVTFTNTVCMKETVFSAVTSFNSTTFAKEVDLSYSYFSKGVDFRETNFQNIVRFSSSNFDSLVMFDSSTFGVETFFDSVSFKGLVGFFHASFNAGVNFHFSRFGGRTSFDHSGFEGGANFIGVQFEGRSSFSMSSFGVIGSEETTFLDLTDVRFKEPTNFRSVKFLSGFPNFEGAIMHENTVWTWEDESWSSAYALDAKQGRDSCAHLRHHLGKQGLPEGELFFFRREMAFAKKIGKWPEQLPYKFYGLISDFGHSIALPVWYLFCLFVAPLGMYFAAFGADSVNAAANSAGLSFSSIFKFFGFQRLYFGQEFMAGVHWSVRLATAAQTVLGYIFLFFLGLGLRTRFRLR